MCVVTKESNPELYNALFPEDRIKEKQLNKVLYGLDYIGNKIKNDDGELVLGVNYCKLLLDYITNLQDKIDKAVEYIDIFIQCINEQRTTDKEKVIIGRLKNLKSLLKGDSGNERKRIREYGFKQ